MKQSNDFAHDMIDLDTHPDRLLFLAGQDVKPMQNPDGTISIVVSLQGMRHNGTFRPIGETRQVRFTLCAYGKDILRFSGAFADEKILQDSIMLDLDPSVAPSPLVLRMSGDGLYVMEDPDGTIRARITTASSTVRHWSDLQRPGDPMIGMEFYPSGDETCPVRFMRHDHFFPGKLESAPLGCLVDKHAVSGTVFSLHSNPDAHFYGTGERFGRLDLAGRTITLENTDALGTASRKAYKNVPFFFSSEGYGLFVHSSAHMRLSFADISNRAVQGLIEESRLDLFVIGGGNPQRIINNYRRLTGFSPDLPRWSYGMWMSRMTYFSADEVRTIVKRLRKEGYPCDVIHLDSGYFANDWVCDWKFSPNTFPNPSDFIREMRRDGIHISVWQTPNIGKENSLYQEAVEHRYLPPTRDSEVMRTMSDFSGQDFGGQIDFTDEGATAWYKDRIRGLLDLGVECIKTDFGEKILQQADFRNMRGEMLHNIYCLLYQKAAFETTGEYGDRPFIWARATWAGGQRYPLHWGGDTASTWDGMSSTLRGGLQLGMSGYAFWSHDIPGFHGLPEFMNSWPSENLYLRWTQFGAFTSHMRYHGTSPREPWEFPGCAQLVRQWLRLRYALIPYIMQEAAWCTDRNSGRPMIAPLLFDYPADPNVWHIDNEYLFGRDLLVAPIMNDDGIRDIYLPEGDWIELCSGRYFPGTRWLKGVRYPLAAFPVFVRSEAAIPYYPYLVDSTEQMDMTNVHYLRFNVEGADEFEGLARSPLGKLCGFSDGQLAIDFGPDCV